MSTTESPVGPFFVGGTGRSGTTIAAELIGSARQVALVPIELRLHVDKGGLADLASGAATVDEFVRRLRRTWFIRKANANGPRGLHVVTERPVMRRAIARLREEYPDDPWAATGRFLDALVRPWQERHEAATWVEMTPPNARAMDALTRMLPTARVVHMVRDGRDVAASVARRSWGPDDVEAGVVWWADQLIAIEEARRRSDPERVHTVRLEALVGDRRLEEYEKLVAFLGLGGSPETRRFFDERVTPGDSHAGAWRRGLDDEVCRRVESLYDEQLARLDRAGVRLPPVD